MIEDWGEVLRLLLTGAAVGVSARWLGRRLTRRLLRRQLATGRIHVAARSPGTAHPVLSPIWQTYRARARPGRLDLQHWLISDSGTPITVDQVDPGARRPRPRELWRLDVSDARVLTMRTPEGLVELAVSADHVDWLRGRVAGADLPATD